MNKKSINASGLDAGRGSNTQSIVFSGLLVATSIIFTRFLGFMAFGGAVRISFGGLPIALAGALMGPFWGAMTGIVADVLGATLFPQGAFFPGFTLTAALSGLIPGLVLYRRKPSISLIAISSILSAVICSLILNTFWLTILLNKGFLVLLPTRIVSALAIAFIEAILLKVLLTAFRGHFGKTGRA